MTRARPSLLTQVLELDARLMGWVLSWRRPYLHRFMRTLTRLGDTPTWTGAWLLGVAAGVSNIFLVGGVGVATSVVTQIVKRLARRPRPSETGNCHALEADPDAFSFPSGHTATATAIATAALLVGWPAPGVLFALAGLMGLSRIYLGAHYPLDVLIGAALGGGAAWALVAGLGRA